MTINFPIRVLLLVLMAFSFHGCAIPTSPSKAITIDLKHTKTSKDDVINILDEIIKSRGYHRIESDGRDKISGKTTTIGYNGLNEITILIAVDESKKISVRVSQDKDIFDIDADKFFDGLRTTLEERWPGAIYVDSEIKS